MLKKIISGGQTGADIAGLVVAKRLGIPTGGTMPKGFKTLRGPQPDYAVLFGIEEHSSQSYVPRTHKNVKDSDGTLRLAYNFGSAGEICTLNAINKYGKVHLDVHLAKPQDAKEVAKWILENKIETLNIAGNSEETAPGTYEAVKQYLTEVLNCLEQLREEEHI
jgi:hypothetical protein